MEETNVSCPYCGEIINILIDTSVEEQQYFEDCSVCCAPILFDVVMTTSTEIQLTVKREDD
jgi:hypothetical protein